MTVGSEDRTALNRGITALRRLADGVFWRGFPTLAGRSDVWVTAFVTGHLAEVPEMRKRLAATRAWLALHQHESGGWSYGEDVPADADSTAWCLIALRGSPALSPDRRREAISFLDSRASVDGVSTFDDGVDGIRKYIGTSPDVSIAGWTASHPDVTAAAILAGWPREEPFDPLLSRLVARQTGAGVWESYWWRGPWYMSALLLRAAQARGRTLPDDHAKRLIVALEREQNQSGGFSLGGEMEDDAFSTALALDCFERLAEHGGEEARARARSALLSMQRDDGAWPGGYVLRIPAPGIVDPAMVSGWRRGTGGGNSFVMDEGGLFATVAAVSALSCPARVPRTPDRAVSALIGSPEPDIVTVVRG